MRVSRPFIIFRRRDIPRLVDPTVTYVPGPFHGKTLVIRIDPPKPKQ